MSIFQNTTARTLVGMAMALASLAPGGGQEVGNGGDPLYLIMQKARVDAVAVVTEFKTSDPTLPMVQAQFDADVYAFLMSSQSQTVHVALAVDIEHSEHEFLTDSTQSTCARTNLPGRPAGLIAFSLPVCRTLLEADGEGRAVELLIHEAVHHFGVGGTTQEESFATRVAVQLVGFWQRRQQANAPQWQAMTMQGGPEARYQATSVALDQDAFFVWGGCNGSSLPNQESCERFLNNGKTFKLVGDGGAWSDVATQNAPSGRKLASGVYTGNSVIVWGGCQGGNAGCEQSLNDGGIYDVASDSWQALPATLAAGRTRHTAIWTGQEMIVYGGKTSVSAAPFSQILNDMWILKFSPTVGWRWRQVTVPATVQGRFGHSAVWAGDRLVVFGGCAKSGLFSCQQRLNDAFTFDPATSQFTVMAPAPEHVLGRLYASAVWTGTHVILWGGLKEAGTAANDGLILDLESPSNPWTPIDALLPSGEQAGRYFHQATWTGDSMLVYGGVMGDGEFSQKVLQFRYLPNSPSEQSWRLIQTPTEPIGRKEHAQFWTEAGLVVWGGYGARNTFLPTGGNLRNVR